MNKKEDDETKGTKSKQIAEEIKRRIKRNFEIEELTKVNKNEYFAKIRFLKGSREIKFKIKII